MIREMLRKKQLLSHTECIEMLERNTNGILAMAGDDGYPYGVPMSYVYYEGKIYFHCAKKGYKIDCMNANPKVCFTVVDMDQIVPEEYTTYYRSVVVLGKVRLTEGEEKHDGFMALNGKYSGMMPLEDQERVIRESGPHALLYAIDIDHLTGKQAIELIKKSE